MIKKKNFKNLLLQNRMADIIETWYTASALRYYQTCSNDDPRLTFDFIIQRSNGFLTLNWISGERYQWDFSYLIIISVAKSHYRRPMHQQSRLPPSVTADGSQYGTWSGQNFA